MNGLGEPGSLGRRLTLTLLSGGIAALWILCAWFAHSDFAASKHALAEHTQTLARVVARQSVRAAAERDAAVAAARLRMLSDSPSFVSAAIYDRSGKRLAGHSSDDFDSSSAFPAADGALVQFSGSHVDVRHPIESNGERFGTVAIRSSTHAIQSRLASIFWASIVATLLVIALSIAAGSWLHGRVVPPLAELTRAVRSVASGDLAVRVDARHRDEVHGVADAFNEMTAALRGVVSRVGGRVGELRGDAGTVQADGRRLADVTRRLHEAIEQARGSVSQVSSSIHEVNDNVEQLADSARDTSSSIVEMDASIRAVAEHMEHLDQTIDSTSIAVSQVAANTDQVVGHVSTLESATEGTLGRLEGLTRSVAAVESNARASQEISDLTHEEAGRGLVAVRETIVAMHEISNSFEQLDESVTRLAGNSNAIDEILLVIQGVADQTSLLSLNAAIIAAQAGEYGRAFAVVAEEIDTLASRTRRSVSDISQLISAVGEDTAAAVDAAKNGAAVVQLGVHRSNEAGEVLEQIGQKSKASSERVYKISDAASQQGRHLARVDQAMREVSKIVEQITEATRDQHTATAEIVSAVENIRSVAKGVKNSTAEQRKGSQLITRAVTEVAGMINHIAEATSTQTKSRETIQHALDALTEASEESTRLCDGIGTGVSRLATRAEQLQTEMAHFDASDAEASPSETATEGEV